MENENSFDRLVSLQKYILNEKPLLNLRALFSDGSNLYRCPSEPNVEDEIKVRLRTAINNVDKVYVNYFIEETRYQVEAVKIKTDSMFDYFEGVIPPSDQFIEYNFEVYSGSVICYYNSRGYMESENAFYNFGFKPGFHTPQWAKGAVFYQIYVDRFANGDPSNDVLDREYCYIGDVSKRVTDWNKIPETMDVREFYGGDLQGVWDHLDYLEELGIEALYLNPIFVSPSNHKYDIQDYDYVDPHYGVIVSDEGDILPEWSSDNTQATKYSDRVTNKKNLEASNEFFIKFVEEVHRRGMKIILDGVFNHCGSFNKWLDRERIYENQQGYEKGAYVDAASPYRSYFRFKDQNAWPYNNSYDGWWGHDTLPKLNYEESEQLRTDILGIAQKWVSPPFNVDGWRLDVAADLGYSTEYNHHFWQEFRTAVKTANKDAIILAEHYGDPSLWLKGDQWDTVMNYDAFMEPLTWFLTGVEKHSDEYRGDLLNNVDSFWAAMTHHMSRCSRSTLAISMNEISNHDHSRFLTRTNGTVGRLNTKGGEAASYNINYGVFREAVVLQMTWIGAPTIYYGDEAGLCGWTDPDNRRGYPWGREDQSLIQLHKDLIQIRRDNPSLKEACTKSLKSDYGVLCYGRFDEESHFVIAMNNNDSSKEVVIKVWEIGLQNDMIMEQLIMTTEQGHHLEVVEYVVEHGELKIEMPRKSAVILRRR